MAYAYICIYGYINIYISLYDVYVSHANLLVASDHQMLTVRPTVRPSHLPAAFPKLWAVEGNAKTKGLIIQQKNHNKSRFQNSF